MQQVGDRNQSGAAGAGGARASAPMRVPEFGAAVLDAVDRVLVGKRSVTEQVLVALLCEGHVLLEDVPGVGKTTMARAVARAIGGEFRRIQFTPDLLPSDISGLSYFNQKLGDFQFRAGPVFTNVLLADEINRATPRTQSALLEAMEERTVSVEGETMPLPRPFLVLATENPVELEGTFPLPEAQLDRFLLRLNIGYPDAAEEEELLTRLIAADQAPATAASVDRAVDRVEQVVTLEQLQAASRAVRQVHVEPEVRQYIVNVVRATREHEALELGASPRGTIALFRAAQALAALRDRAFVTPEDVKVLVPAVLTHRLMLAPDARLRGRTVTALLREILESVRTPLEAISTR